MLGDVVWHGPLVLAFWVRRGSILTHYEKNCGVSKFTGAIFSAQFLKNSISEKFLKNPPTRDTTPVRVEGFPPPYDRSQCTIGCVL